MLKTICIVSFAKTFKFFRQQNKRRMYGTSNEVRFQTIGKFRDHIEWEIAMQTTSSCNENFLRATTFHFYESTELHTIPARFPVAKIKVTSSKFVSFIQGKKFRHQYFYRRDTSVNFFASLLLRNRNGNL